MVVYNCFNCQFSTPNKFNYERHLTTKKHLLKKSKNAPKNEQNEPKNEQNEQKMSWKKSATIQQQNLKNEKSAQNPAPWKCPFCDKSFNKIYNLQRHITVCKLTGTNVQHQTAPNSTKKCAQKVQFQCTFCNQIFARNYTLNRHYDRCKVANDSKTTKERDFKSQLWRQEFIHQQQLSQKDFENRLLQKDLEKEQAVNQEKEKSIQIAKGSKQIIHNHTTNKTINYLNSTYGNMIAMDQFLYNLEHTVQLTQEERQKLLMSYKDSGIELFARSFSHIMKENCKRQLMKEGLPEMNLIPLYCSDGNFRSHKEKSHQGWNTCYDNQSLNKMINISSDQVYESYQKSLMIFGKQRNKVFKQIKQDNHSQKEEKIGFLKDKK